MHGGEAYAPARGCDARLNALCDHICPLREMKGPLLARLDAAAEARVDDETQLAARRAQLLGLAPGARRALEWRLRRAAAEDALEERLLRLLQGVRAERIFFKTSYARAAAHGPRAL